MNIKQIFNGYRQNQRQIQKYKNEIECRKAAISPSRTSHWDEVPAYSKGNRSDPTAKTVLNRMEDEQIAFLEAQKAILETDIKFVDDLLELLPELERTIIEKRFIYGHSVQFIAIEMDRSEYSVYRAINKIFSRLESFFPSNEVFSISA